MDFLLCFCKPVISHWALQENNALELANQSTHYIGFKRKPYNKKCNCYFRTNLILATLVNKG